MENGILHNLYEFCIYCIDTDKALGIWKVHANAAAYTYTDADYRHHGLLKSPAYAVDKNYQL